MRARVTPVAITRPREDLLRPSHLPSFTHLLIWYVFIDHLLCAWDYAGCLGCSHERDQFPARRVGTDNTEDKEIRREIDGSPFVGGHGGSEPGGVMCLLSRLECQLPGGQDPVDLSVSLSSEPTHVLLKRDFLPISIFKIKKSLSSQLGLILKLGLWAARPNHSSFAKLSQVHRSFAQ